MQWPGRYHLRRPAVPGRAGVALVCGRVSSSLLLPADPCRQWVWSCRTGGYPRLRLGQLSMAEQSPTLPQTWAWCIVGGPAAHSLSSIGLVL